MEIIGKSKIANWLRQYPEGKSELLVWLREFNLNNRPGGAQGPRMIKASLGTGYYGATVIVNPQLDTFVVTRFGTREALRAEEMELFKIAYPGEEMVTKTVTVKVATTAVKLTTPLMAESQLVNPGFIYDTTVPFCWAKIDNDAVLQLKTTVEYEYALNRAITIFEAKPGMPEFEELQALLPQIKAYEHKHIEVPELTPLDVVKQKTTMLSMDPLSLLYMARVTETQMNAFMQGENALTDEQLMNIYKALCVRFVR